LRSNGVPAGDTAHSFAPMRESTAIADEPAALRRRFERDGYVLVRGLLDPSLVLRLRSAYLALADASRDAEYGTPGHAAHQFVRGPEFDAFTRDPGLLTLAESLLGSPAELLPRRILRHFEPDSARASRAHTDFDYLDHGTERIVTIWIPVGDCPIECGGLSYLQASHQLAPAELEPLRAVTDRPADRRPISHDLDRTAQAFNRRWLWADYRAGDVVAHSPRIVHASTDNVSDAPRVSIDLRFHAVGCPSDPRWQGDWSADDGY